MNKDWSVAIGIIGAGILIHVLTALKGHIYDLPWLVPAFLPYAASLVVLAITRTPSIATWSAVFAFGVDLILFFPVVLFPSASMGGVVWFFAHWWNLFLFFPLGLAIGLYRDRDTL